MTSKKEKKKTTPRKPRHKAEKRTEDPFLKTTKHITTSIFFGLIFMYLIANIIVGQDVPDWYTDLTNGEIKAEMEFFEKATQVSSFQTLLPEVRKTYSMYEQEVYQDEQKRADMISRLEESLLVNPESRDTLYALYLLYKYEGNESRASDYLNKAKEVDPQVEKYFAQ